MNRIFRVLQVLGWGQWYTEWAGGQYAERETFTIVGATIVGAKREDSGGVGLTIKVIMDHITWLLFWCMILELFSHCVHSLIIGKRWFPFVNKFLLNHINIVFSKKFRNAEAWGWFWSETRNILFGESERKKCRKWVTRKIKKRLI